MSRDVINIPHFNHGIITSPDPGDIPEDAATFSLDIDGVSKPGELCARKEDLIYATDRGIYAKNNAFIVEDNGWRTLISHNGNNNEIEYAHHFFNEDNPSDAVVLGAAGSSPTFSRHNKEVHIGMGAESLDVPKWVGRPAAKQFGGINTNDLIMVDAELKYPSSIPFFHKVVWDGTYFYGFELGGDRLYKVTVATGEVVTSEFGIFRSLTAICFTAGGLHVWVYDRGASTNGTIYKVLLSDLSIVYTTVLGPFLDGGGVAIPLGLYVSDMIAFSVSGVTASLILAMYHPTPSELPLGFEGFLFKIAEPAGSGNVNPINCTPCLSPRTVAGNPVLDGDVTIPGRFGAGAQELFPLSLVTFSSTRFGWALHAIKGTRYELLTTATTSGVLLNSFIYSLSGLEDPAGENHAPVVRFDSVSDANIGADGFVYDSLASTVFWGTGKYLHSHSLTYPTAAGVATDITAGITTSSELTYRSAPSQLYGTGPAIIYLTRKSGVPGVDTINSSFAAFTVKYNGSQISIAPSNSGEANVFTEETTYFYKGALQYDTYQQSPLSILTTSKTNTTGVTLGASLAITIEKIDTLSPRVSDLLIFRAQGAEGAALPEGFYRLALTIPLSDQRWIISGTTATITVTDNSLSGSSYEAITGIPETVPNTMVNYALSAQLNSELFVTKCYHPDLPDALHMVFKSKAARYDMIDWTTSFLRLPIVPTAIASYGGRIYVFDENDMYRINPDGMFIEDTLRGVGALGQHSVLVTKHGMFVACKAAIFWYNGQQMREISKPINFATTSTNTFQWSSVLHTNHAPILGYDATLGYVVIAISDTTDRLLLYHPELDRWDLWSVPYTETTNIGMFNDPDGTLYLSAEYSYVLAGGTTQHTAYWYSKKFTAGDPSQLKKFYKVRMVCDEQFPRPTIAYANDEDETYTVFNGDTLTYFGNYKSIRLRLVFASTSQPVESLSIIYRSLIGKR